MVILFSYHFYISHSVAESVPQISPIPEAEMQLAEPKVELDEACDFISSEKDIAKMGHTYP